MGFAAFRMGWKTSIFGSSIEIPIFARALERDTTGTLVTAMGRCGVRLHKQRIGLHFSLLIYIFQDGPKGFF